MLFALYYRDNDDEPICGSDSILPIDGRYSIQHAIDYVHHHNHTKFLKHNKIANKFRICYGNIKHYSFKSFYQKM